VNGDVSNGAVEDACPSSLGVGEAFCGRRRVVPVRGRCRIVRHLGLVHRSRLSLTPRAPVPWGSEGGATGGGGGSGCRRSTEEDASSHAGEMRHPPPSAAPRGGAVASGEAEKWRKKEDKHMTCGAHKYGGSF
jgi:hypothetical protein